MNAADILNAWAKYSEYDPDQKSFNLLSSKYYMHNASKNAAAINDYDPTGNLAVLYLKEMFRRLCKDSTMNVMELLEHPEGLVEHKKMWDMFHSRDVKSIEDAILGAMDGIIRRIVPVKQLGERDLDAERSALADSITGVVEQLGKCNVEFFLRSAVNIGQLNTFSTDIHVFDTLAQCLLTLEGAKDAMYICYIRNRDSIDGYFGFFVKSNGTIFSVNERVNEAYPGQHKRSRNGRWAEAKAYQIFPYSLMKEIGERDYLGWAHHYTIDDSNLKLFQLGPEGYMPLVLAMIMLSVKYSGDDPQRYRQMFVDALLPHNLELAEKSEETALIVPENSLVVAGHRNYVIDLTTEDVMSGKAGERFDRRRFRDAGIQKSWGEQGVFPDKENIFVQLYGEGFVLDKDRLIEKDRQLRLPSSWDIVQKNEEPNFEFVGSAEKMDLIAYREARIQLAEYVRDRMFEEYIAFGGVAAVRAWFNQELEKHKDELIRICVEAFAEAEAANSPMDTNLYNTFLNSHMRGGSGYRIGIEYDKNGVRAWSNEIGMPFNKVRIPVNNSYSRWACAVDHSTKASYRFHIVFTDWTDMAKMFGEENIPKIVKGYNYNGHDSEGNCLLDCVDLMSEVGTPFEDREYNMNPRYWTKSKYQENWWRRHNIPLQDQQAVPENVMKEKSVNSFYLTIALSKRSINKLLKERKGEK